MASSSSIPAASAAPVATKTSRLGAQCHLVRSNLSFRPSPGLNLAVSASTPFSQGSLQHRSSIVKLKLNEVSVGGSSNVSDPSADKSGVAQLEKKDADSEKQSVSTASVSDSSIAEFMAEVANLVKLVDSRDIVELQLKQLDCELVIRKKEALPQPPSPAPMVLMQPPTPQAVTAAQSLPVPVAATAPPPSATPAPALPPPAAKSSRSSHPPLKCPMAGTFYRSPGPGEPPFVKVGDKVKKGQVLCIIEAMKLMNEIEADQSGTIVEVLVDDGKTVSMDMPLFIIDP